MRIASLAAATLIVALIAGCGSLPVKPREQTEIAPSKAYEDCLEMKLGDSLVYSFEASKPLDFNLHCHEGSEVVCPVEKAGITSLSSTFIADRDQYFCLMWTNPNKEAVRLNYSYSLQKKK